MADCCEQTKQSLDKLTKKIDGYQRNIADLKRKIAKLESPSNSNSLEKRVSDLERYINQLDQAGKAINGALQPIVRFVKLILGSLFK